MILWTEESKTIKYAKKILTNFIFSNLHLVWLEKYHNVLIYSRRREKGKNNPSIVFILSAFIFVGGHGYSQGKKKQDRF